MPSYVGRDYHALAQHFDVSWGASLVGWRRGSGPRGWIPSPSTLRVVRASKVVLQWFALPLAPALAAVMLRRPLVVVAGGYDVAAVPEIGYGRMLGARTRFMGRSVLRLARRVLSVSRYTQAEVARAAPGVRAEVLYHGFEASAFSPARVRVPKVVSVATLRRDYVRRKGLDTFAKASRLLPDVPFVLAGRIADQGVAAELLAWGGPNLSLAGGLSDAALRELLGHSAVYLQPSIHEAFGCAVAEAMLSGCTPVVSDRGALPEVVGDCGYVIPADDPAQAAAAVRSALVSPRASAARERVERLFSWSARERGLLDSLTPLVTA